MADRSRIHSSGGPPKGREAADTSMSGPETASVCAADPMSQSLTALFFAALPYRRAIFARGKWPPLVPELRPWQTHRRFLSCFWSGSDLRRSEARARRFLDESGPRPALLFGMPGYPGLLGQIYDPPPALFFHGEPPREWDVAVAVVGTRRPDAICLRAVDRLAEQIQRSPDLRSLLHACVVWPGIPGPESGAARPPRVRESPTSGRQLLLFEEAGGAGRDAAGAGDPSPGPSPGVGVPSGSGGTGQAGRLVTVSGFAFGVDERIHLASLHCGVSTLGVLGSGIDTISPWRNRYLLDEVGASGASLTLLSEFFPDDPPRQFAYPRRNRIIAGMSPVVFVMQAGRGSGALITARYALDEGREVCAFDHPDLLGAGKNEGARSLLDEGAGRLVVFSGG